MGVVTDCSGICEGVISISLVVTVSTKTHGWV